MCRARSRERALILLAVLVGALLRVYPMHRPYLGLELQELYPSNAVVAIARHNWEPFSLHHGGGFLTVLRALFTAWYAAGRFAGLYADRIDLLAAYVRDPFPFVLAGRLAVLAAALLSIYLVGRVGARLFSTAAGVAGALLLAVTFMHVRESHHVWLDVPAGAAALGAVAASLSACRAGGAGRVALAGALGGVALAAKYSTVPIVLPILLAAWWADEPHWGAIMRRLLVAGAAALLAFALLSPYGILKFRETVHLLTTLHGLLFGKPGASLDLGTCIRQGFGTGIAVLAILGLVVGTRAAPRPAAIVASFSLGYLAVLALESLLYARYLAVLAPFAALFAGCGACALARRFTPRHPLLGVGAIVLLAGAAPALQSVEYDRFLALRDTRQLAADWILAHVPSGTPLTLSNMVPYPNPTLPLDAAQLERRYGEFAAALKTRGIADPARTYPMRFLAFFDGFSPDWQPSDRFVVTAYHPVVLRVMNVPPNHLARLGAAGARAVVRFEGFREPLPTSVVYEPAEADYVPLAGFGALVRPGPNLTVWELPER